MPKSHDAKPRNWHRRNKARKQSTGYPIGCGPQSRRSRFKQVLSFRAKEAATVQIAVERMFRAKGVAWRAVEKAVHNALGGRFSHLGEIKFDVSPCGVVTWSWEDDDRIAA